MTLQRRYLPTSDMIKWGWMRKKGSDRRNWSDRWVILSKSGELKCCSPSAFKFPYICSTSRISCVVFVKSMFSSMPLPCRYYKTPQDTNCQGSLNVHEYAH